MGGGNGNKAAMKRARAQDKGPTEAKSQLRANENAKSIQCEFCKATFLSTTRLPDLKDHAAGHHSKTMEELFPYLTEDQKRDKKPKKEGGKGRDKKDGGEKKAAKK